MRKILIVDDEPDILEFLKYNLDKQGYDTYTAANGVEGLKIALETIPDLIILNIMMPEMDGIEACKIIKENSIFRKTLVVFLSARGEDYTQIAGFESGADDFIVKPIKIRVLIEKIKALLKRTIVVDVKNKIFINELIIDKNKFSVTKDNVAIDLPKKEFELLFLLASNPKRVYKRTEIFNIIWGSDTIVGDRTIDVHIRKLREKLGENLIKTIKGVGYRFEV